MALKTIQHEKRRLADEVYNELTEAIVQRYISHEDVLVQEKLAKEMQISRTPVREALLRLEQEGVLEVSNRGSFRLYKMDDDEVRELCQSRAAIEGQCARILAVNHTQEDIIFLRRMVDKEENIRDQSARSHFKANRNIHRNFVKRAKNRFLLDMFDINWGKALVFPLFATIKNADFSQSLGDHLKLVDAIASGDGIEALETFIAHANMWLKQDNHTSPRQTWNMKPPLPETLFNLGT
jgi:DNA-binding GntR family transcriptional regulator